MGYFVLIPFLIIGTIVLWLTCSPKHKGKVGEKKVYEVLSSLSEDYHVYNDLMLKTSWVTTQIDHVVVSRYGVFVIETKNYRGDIYGNDEKEEWEQIIVTPVTYMKKWWKTYTYVTKNRMYNPVKQCQTHINAIKNIMAWPQMPTVLVVVFTGNANLSNVRTKYHVIQLEELLGVISSYTDDKMTDSDVQQVCYAIEKNNVRDSVDNKTHVKNVKQIVYQKNLKISNGICPKCGGNLVLRNGRYGSFYGCSNYPNCKFTCDC